LPCIGADREGPPQKVSNIEFSKARLALGSGGWLRITRRRTCHVSCGLQGGVGGRGGLTKCLKGGPVRVGRAPGDLSGSKGGQIPAFRGSRGARRRTRTIPRRGQFEPRASFVRSPCKLFGGNSESCRSWFGRLAVTGFPVRGFRVDHHQKQGRESGSVLSRVGKPKKRLPPHFGEAAGCADGADRRFLGTRKNLCLRLSRLVRGRKWWTVGLTDCRSRGSRGPWLLQCRKATMSLGTPCSACSEAGSSCDGYPGLTKPLRRRAPRGIGSGA